MRYMLKLSICLFMLLFLLLNTSYFCENYVIPFWKKYYYAFVIDPRQDLEPLTIRGNDGGLGNQMFTFATLYGLGRLNKRAINIMPKNYRALINYFDLKFPQTNLSSFRVRNPWMIRHWLTAADSSIPATSNILSGNIYPTSFTFFDHVRDEIRKIFQFRAPLRKHALNVLAHVKKIRPWTQVHVRRGDYLHKSPGGWLRAASGREVDVAYFTKAVQHYRNKYRNITFLAVSDDRKWTRENLSSLGILTLPQLQSAGHDMAILAACNHSIITYGTFGFWGSFLAGGDVVYFADFVKPGSGMAEIFVMEKIYPKEWTGISTTPGGFWDKYTNPFL